MWVFGGSIASKQFGQLRNGKCITVQATAAGRQQKGAKRGNRPLIPGRPVGDITEMRMSEIYQRANVHMVLLKALPMEHRMLGSGNIISLANNYTRILT